MHQFSLVMPVYNQVDLLSTALNCVYEQTRHDYEFIVVDVGSSDGSLELLAREEAQGRLHLIHGDSPDAGPHVACGLGARQSSGRWLVFFDPRGMLLFDHLSRFADAIATHPHFELFVNAWQRMQGHHRLPREDGVARGVLLRRQALAAFARYDFIHLNGVCLRRERFLELGGFPERRHCRGGDAYLWLKALCVLEAIHYDDTVTSLWLLDQASHWRAGPLPARPHPCVEVRDASEATLGRCERHYLRAATNRQVLAWALEKKRQGQSVRPDLEALRLTALLRPRHLYQALSLAWPRPRPGRR